MGRGVAAKQNFNPGDCVEASPCLILSHTKSWIHRTELNFYVFRNHMDDSTSLLALGKGSLFNHSYNNNVTYLYDPIKNFLVFRATRKIKKGEQLFINYGYDPVYEKEKRAGWITPLDPLDPVSPGS